MTSCLPDSSVMANLLN